MQRGLGWNREQENHAWLAANQKRFDRSHFMAYRVPDEIDGRASQAIKDQGQLGSCSGFSRSSLEERLNYLTTGAKGPALSAMFCYLTNQQECGCAGGDNGATIAGSVSAAGKEGVCEETLFPYTSAMAAGQYTGTIPAAATAEGKLHLVASHSVIHDYQTAIQYLGTAGVIQIGIPVGDQFQNCSGPLTAPMVQKDARNPEGGHALAVIGYLKPATIGQPAGDGRAWLIGQNSWGSDGWGSQGFFFIQPAAWDYLCKSISHGDVEIIGLSGLTAFDDPSSALNWNYA
jgi:C1A family cysteine protease